MRMRSTPHLFEEAKADVGERHQYSKDVGDKTYTVGRKYIGGERQLESVCGRQRQEESFCCAIGFSGFGLA